MLNNTATRFIQFCLANRAIRFGDFVLKSGRKSPYFFNAGVFSTGETLKSLGEYYAETLTASGIQFDMLFGPAYKGIPLVAATSIALANEYQRNVPFCFNRKEAKDHGEGGSLVGADLFGRVVIIDDVMTAGTAVRHSIEIISKSQASLAGVVVLLDRQERGESGDSATREIADRYQVPVLSVICLDDIIQFVQNDPTLGCDPKAMLEYRRQYGVS